MTIHVQEQSSRPSTISGPILPAQLTEIRQIVRGLPKAGQPLSKSTAESLLRYLLVDSHKLGFLGIVLGKAYLQCTNGGPEPLETEMGSQLTLTLLAVALELFGHQLPPASREKEEAHKDLLRASSLELLPDIGIGKGPFHLGNVLSLLLLSHTWCAAEGLADSCLRWHSLAYLVFKDLCNMKSVLVGESSDFMRQ